MQATLPAVSNDPCLIDVYDQLATVDRELDVGLELLDELAGELVQLARLRDAACVAAALPALARRIEWVAGRVRAEAGDLGAVKRDLDMLRAIDWHERH